MSLDFHQRLATGPLLYRLDDAHYAQWQPAFDQLDKRTGTFLDPYADTRLTPGHARLLAALVRSLTPAHPDADGFIAMLEKAADEDITLFVLGD